MLIYNKINAVKEKLPMMVKEKQAFKGKYVTLQKILSVLNPILINEGLYVNISECLRTKRDKISTPILNKDKEVMGMKKSTICWLDFNVKVSCLEDKSFADFNYSVPVETTQFDNVTQGF